MPEPLDPIQTQLYVMLGLVWLSICDGVKLFFTSTLKGCSMRSCLLVSNAEIGGLTPKSVLTLVLITISLCWEGGLWVSQRNWGEHIWSAASRILTSSCRLWSDLVGKQDCCCVKLLVKGWLMPHLK